MIIFLNRQFFSKKTKKSKFLPEFQYIYFASISGYNIASRSLFSLHWRKKTSNVFNPKPGLLLLLLWFFFSRRVALAVFFNLLLGSLYYVQEVNLKSVLFWARCIAAPPTVYIFPLLAG